MSDKKVFKRIACFGIVTSLTVGALFAVGVYNKDNLLNVKASDSSYPAQEFRIGISDTNRNVNVSSNSSVNINSQINNGTDSERWTLNYISSGVYEIVNSQTGEVITNNNGVAVASKDVDGANQRWKIEAVEQDFEGYDLYYKIVSNADNSVGLTFNQNSNSISVDSYKGSDEQKFRLELYGLEGYAGYSLINGKMKAGTIGGLLGETVKVNTTEALIEALDSTEPKTVVLTADLDLVNWSKENQRIRDNKTLIGSYSKNTIYDCQLRNDDFNGKDPAPSNNIVIKNMNFVARQLNSGGSGVILIYIYGGRNIWIDHCDFSATFEQNRDSEVGKFIWINTPSESWSDAAYNKINPDYITISYNYFKNRYWTVAYGSQNKDTSRLRTTMMFNKWEQCSRRCPQYSNGYHHNYSCYHTVTGSSNPNASSQIIGGEGSRILSENNRFEAYTGLEFTIDGLAFEDRDSYTAKTTSSTPTQVKTTSKGDKWNASDSYGYSLVAAYNTNGTDTKDFCNSYSGCFTSDDKIKYITDSDMEKYISKKYDAPYLKNVEVGSEEVKVDNSTSEDVATGDNSSDNASDSANSDNTGNSGSNDEAANINVAEQYKIKNVNSELYLDANNGAVQQNSEEDIWMFESASEGYYRMYTLIDNVKYALSLEQEASDNGIKLVVKDSADTDASLFGLVKNDDDSYTITTKVSNGASCLGIGKALTDAGENVIQWTRDNTDNQKWMLEAVVNEQESDSAIDDDNSDSNTDNNNTITDDNNQQSGTDDSNEIDDTPKTGDTTLMIILITIVVLSGISMIMYIKKKSLV